jgi:hypothetical protein
LEIKTLKKTRENHEIEIDALKLKNKELEKNQLQKNE